MVPLLWILRITAVFPGKQTCSPICSFLVNADRKPGKPLHRSSFPDVTTPVTHGIPGAYWQNDTDSADDGVTGKLCFSTVFDIFFVNFRDEVAGFLRFRQRDDTQPQLSDEWDTISQKTSHRQTHGPKMLHRSISAKPASHRRLTPKRNIPGRNRGYLKGDLYNEKTYNSPMPFVRNMHGALVARPQEFTPARRWVRRPMWVDRRLTVGAPSPVGQGGISHAKGPNAWDSVVRHLFHSRPAV